MFEKEAKEYAVNTRTQKEIEVLNTVQDWGMELLSPEERHLWEGIRDRQVAREQGFKDGVEFGYNKANEWHYVADGDLPEVDNGIVLCVCGDGYIDEKKHYILKLLTRKEFPLFQPVYAWKEIVLPKE